MLKVSVRRRISLIIVVAVLIGSGLLAGCSPDLPASTPYAVWDFSYLLSSCDFSGFPIDPFPMVWYWLPADFVGLPTVGEFINGFVSALTSPTSPVHCSNVPTDVALFTDTHVVPDDTVLSSFASMTGITYLHFGPHPKNKEFVRLTLFGYLSEDNHSCVLWSLDGAYPLNVDKTCGGTVQLVCTVKLVEKDLKYDCKDGDDWLGFEIVHDPQWLSWADKFASKNGHR